MSRYSEAFGQLIRELNSLDREHSKVVDYGQGPERVYFEVSDGATVQLIRDAEAELGFALPPSFRSFLSRWNGAVLYRGKWRPGCKIFGTDEIVNRNLIWREQELLPEEQEENIFLFADWGDGDYFAFDTRYSDAIGEYPVLDGDHNISPGTWQVICNSFEEWLARFIEAQGRMFWQLQGLKLLAKFGKGIVHWV